MLTVIKKTDKKPKDRYLWECKCDCGNVVFFPANKLKSRNTSSCGCLQYSEARKIDYTGEKFGKLAVIKRYENYARWIYKCDCDKEVVVDGSRLAKGVVKSCGCLAIENLIDRNKSMATHRMTRTRLYVIWTSMKMRCTNDCDKDYINYGGRGIAFCDDWKKFESFMEWALENGYNEELTLERIGVNGNYEPSNCTWISAKEQHYNTRKNRYIEYNGEKKTVSQWAEIIGITRQGLRYRLEAGWSIEELFTEKDQGNPRKVTQNGRKGRRTLIINGVEKPLVDWAKESGISESTLRCRVRKGLKEDELLVPKTITKNKFNL